MNVGATGRGFELIKFTDLYGVKCSLQQSSLATEDALWFGPDGADPKIMASRTPEGDTGWVPYHIPEDVMLTTRAHLSRSMVEELVAHLQAWLQYGSLVPPRSETEECGPTDSPKFPPECCDESKQDLRDWIECGFKFCPWCGRQLRARA